MARARNLRGGPRLVRQLLGLACSVSVICAAPSFAGTAASGSINTVLPHSGGVMIFNQTGTRTGRPACSTQDRWAINGTTDGGKIIISTLLTAYAQGKQISIQGTGTCTAWSDTETVDYIIVP